MADPKIKYDIEANVNGSTSVEDLERHLRDLGKVLEGDLKKQADAAADAIKSLGEKQGAVTGFKGLINESGALSIELAEAQTEVKRLGGELDAAATRTQSFSRAELEARASLDGKKALLAQTRTELTQLGAATTGAARSTEEYRNKSAALGADIQRLTAEIQLEKAAVTSAAAQTKTAQQAQNRLSAQYEASTTALRKVQGAQLDVNAALDTAGARLKSAGIDATNLSQAERNLGAAMEAARMQALQIVPTYAKVAAASQNVERQTEKTAKTFKEGMASISSQLQNIQNIATVALGGGFAVGLLRDVAQTADGFSNLSARVKLATGDGAAFEKGFKGVQAVALETSSALEGTGVLFSRILQAGKEFNLTQENALGLTRSINQAVQLSGGSAASADAAITQLIQGLQSGVLRGEEFNSVMEQAPRLAQALAAGLGVTTGQLRNMAQAGELSTQTVIKALQTQSAVLQAEFTTLPATVGRAITNLQTQWSLFIGQMDSSTGATAYVAEGINKLASNLDTVARVAGLAGAALTASLAVQGARALRAYAIEATAAAGATNLLSASIAKVPKTINIALAVTGFEVGYQIGEMLRENSALARKFGVGLVGYFEMLVSSLQLAKEAAAAVFTKDTVDAAYDRYIQRNEQIRTTIHEMMRDAEQAPSKVAGAADEAGKQLGATGAAAAAAGQQMAGAGATGAAGMTQAGGAAKDALGIFKELLAEAAKPAPKGGAAVEIAKQLALARSQGLDLDALLRRQLPEALSKLSGPELAKFRVDFTNAMQQSNMRGKELQTGLQLIGEQAAKSLGVDVVAASTRMGEAFRKSDEDMRLLILSLPQLKAAGVDTGRVVGEALSKMLDSAKNQAEVEAVKSRIEALRNELGKPLANGLLDQAKDKLQQLKKAADEAKPGINSLEEALGKLGVTSDKALKDLAAKSKAAYTYLVETGKGSAREMSESFKKMADDSIAANSGVADEFVKSQAAARGWRIEVDQAGKATVVAANDSKRALDGLNTSATNVGRVFAGMKEQAVAALQAMGIEADRVSEKVQKLVQDGQMLAAAFQQRQDNWNAELEGSKYMNRGKTNPVDAVPSFNSREEGEAWWAAWQQQYARDNPFSVKSGGQLGNYMHDLTKFEFDHEMDQVTQREAMEKARKKAESNQSSGGSGSGSGTGGTGGGTGSSGGSSGGQQIDRIVNLYFNSAPANPVPTNQTGQNSLEAMGREWVRVMEQQRSLTGG